VSAPTFVTSDVCLFHCPLLSKRVLCPDHRNLLGGHVSSYTFGSTVTCVDSSLNLICYFDRPYKGKSEQQRVEESDNNNCITPAYAHNRLAFGLRSFQGDTRRCASAGCAEGCCVPLVWLLQMLGCIEVLFFLERHSLKDALHVPKQSSACVTKMFQTGCTKTQGAQRASSKLRRGWGQSLPGGVLHRRYQVYQAYF
jgi:hypothetical protein